jgi:hypothetical protein
VLIADISLAGDRSELIQGARELADLRVEGLGGVEPEHGLLAKLVELLERPMLLFRNLRRSVGGAPRIV